MKQKLLLRLIIGYVLFGILSFTTVAVFTSNYNKNYLREQTASFLYKRRDRSQPTMPRKTFPASLH